jgi:asparagine synthase (glutamine-hydrolysing)
MSGLVPAPILQRTDKIGFATPEKQWLLALRPWVERVLARITTMHFPAIEQNEMQREWMQVMSGRKPFNFRVWRWLNTILWVERFAVEID